MGVFVQVALYFMSVERHYLFSCLFVVVYLTLTDLLRIQPWSPDRRNQTESNLRF